MSRLSAVLLLVAASLVALAVALGLAVGGAAWWLVRTESGTAWLVEQARTRSGDAVVIEEVRGVLAHELSIARVGYTREGWRFEAREVRAKSNLWALLRGHLGIEYLLAGQVSVVSPPDDGQPPVLPASLSLPLPVSVSRVEVARLAVTRGEDEHEARNLAFRYEGGPLVHELRGFRAELPWGGIALDAEAGALAPFAFKGVVSVSRPHPEYPTGLSAQVRGDANRLSADITAKLADVIAKGEAIVTPLARPWLQSLRGAAGPVDLAHIDPSWPRTALDISLDARAVEGTLIAGTLAASNAEPGALDVGRIPVAKLATGFVGDLESAKLEDLRIDLSPGGRLAGSGEVSRERAVLSLRAQGLNLRSIRASFHATALDGHLDIDAGSARQTVQGTLAGEGMRITADAVRAGDVVTVKSARAEAKGGVLAGSGELRTAGALPFQANVTLAGFDPAQFGDYPAGAINGSVAASGTLRAPRRVDAKWTVADSALFERPFATRGAATVAGERIVQIDADARLGVSSATARGRPDQALAWTLQSPRIEELRALWTAWSGARPDEDNEITGRVRASGELTGGLRTGSTTLAVEAENLAYRNEASAARISANGSVSLREDGASRVDVTARRLRVDQWPVERITVRASGTPGKHELQIGAQWPGYDIEGRLRGGWVESGWSGEVSALRNRGTHRFDLVAPVPVRLARQEVRVGRLEATLGEGRLLLREAFWQPGRITSSGEFSSLPAAWLIVPAGYGERLRSTLLIDGRWALQSTPRLNGTLFLRRAGGDLAVTGTPVVDLGLQALAVDARFVDGRLSGQASMESRHGRLALEGSVAPVPGAPGFGITAQSPLEAKGRFDFTQLRVLAQPYFQQGRVDGRLGAELRLTGSLGQPRLEGDVRADGLSVDIPPYGVYLKDGRLRATLEGDTLRVSEFVIQGGDGRFTGSGTLPLKFADGTATLAWEAKAFRLLNRPDMRLVLSGKGNAGFSGGRFALKGALRADQAWFQLEQDRLPELGPDVLVIGQPRPAVVKGQERVPAALDIELDLGEDFYVAGWGYSGEIAGRVRLATSESGEPRAFGRIQAVDGSFLAYGQRLRVDPGVLIFDGPINNPSLDMTAWRRNQAVEAGVQLSGTVRAPRVQLVSQPAVPEAERLSWLVLGHAPGAASGADLALLQAAAGALLPRGRTAPINQRIATALRLDEVTLRGGSQLNDRVVAFGKRLSDRLYVTYEQGLGEAASNLVKLDFSLTDRLSARAEAGTSGGVGLFYRFSWD